MLSRFSPSKPEWSLTELGESLGMYKSRVHRILDTLEAAGFVARDSISRKYRLGWRIQSLSAALDGDATLRAIAKPYLLALQKRTRGAIHIRVLRGNANVIIEALESPLPLRLVRPVGEQSPMHFGASGKVLLAFAPPHVRDLALGSRTLSRFTRRTIQDRDEYLRELQQVRRKGFAFSDEEAVEGVRAIAAPVLSADGYAMAAISSALPATVLPIRSVPIHGRAVARYASLISRRLSETATPTVAAGTQSG